jgi:branched-chain amino acid transport system substrate-binding protein
MSQLIYIKEGDSMRRLYLLLSVILISALIVGAIGCAEEEVTPTAAPLKIGQLNTFTGDLSDFGPAHRAAAALAADHINQAGGVQGTVVTLLARDTATNPVLGVDSARALVDVDKVAAIVGALSSGVSIAVAQSVTVPGGILQISAASTSPGLTVLDDNDFLFRTTVSDAVQGVILGRLAWELGYETASALYINNAYGQGLADQFKATFEEEGGTVLELVAHEGVQPTYASELSRATEGGPDVLVAISYPESAQIYLREALEGAYIDTFLFCDGTKSPDMNEAVGVEQLEGTHGTAAGAPVSDIRLAFESSYEAAFVVVPPLPYLDTTYDAVALIALAAEKAGTTTDSAAIRDALRDVANPPGEVVGPGVDDLKRALELIQDGQDINYEGAGGSQDFDANGDVISTIEIWKIENGEIVSTGRYELP